MGTVTPTKLWELWKLAEIKVEHVIGQIIQHVVAHDEELKALRFDVDRLKKQMAELVKEK